MNKLNLKTRYDFFAPIYTQFHAIQTLGYDRIWRKRVCAEVFPKKRDWGLDLCSGTGLNLKELLKKHDNENLKVLGIDKSNYMLKIAKKKLHNYIKKKIIFLTLSDIQNLPLKTASICQRTPEA